VTIGRARFAEVARGQIAGAQRGLLRLICDGGGQRLLGAQIIGEHAAELIHVGQMAMAAGSPVDTFVDQVFNFPTYAEAWRVAALDVIRQRSQRSQIPAAATTEGSWDDAIAAI